VANRYCTNCGHPLVRGDNFCTGCGAAIPWDATDAAATPTVPAQGHAPSNLPLRGKKLLLLIALGAAALLVLGVGTVAALNLLRGEPENQGGSAPPPENRQEDASTGEREATEVAANVSEKTESSKESDTKPAKHAEASQSEKASGPAPGYNRVQDPSEGLSVEVPSGWGVETGADSENEAGENSWSYYAGEYLISSITTAPSLDTWYTTGSSGGYMAASKVLAQGYTDYELTHSLLNARKQQNCTAGPYEDLDRATYTGKVQTWLDCYADGRTIYSVAAAPEGRECVVLLDAIVLEEADREAIEHLIDTFEVDCGRVTSEELVASPPPAAVPSPAASAPASASAPAASSELICDEYGCMTPDEVARQKQMGEGWWPGSGIERPQPNNCAATQTKMDGC
jgi:hypothetical protein